MDFNFEMVEKNNVSHIPNGMVKVGKGSISMAGDLVGQFNKVARPQIKQGERHKNTATEVIFVKVAYDPSAKALKLIEGDPRNSYAASVFGKSSVACLPIPSPLRRKGIHRGWYELVPGYTNVFQFKN